jgi:translation elongation factor P/translation initiation factor 5A
VNNFLKKPLDFLAKMKYSINMMNEEQLNKLRIKEEQTRRLLKWAKIEEQLRNFRKLKKEEKALEINR